MMNGFIRALMITVLAGSMFACSQKSTTSEDDLSLDEAGLEAPADADVVEAGGGGDDDFADFEESGDSPAASPAQASEPAAPATPAGDELSLDEPATQVAEPSSEPVPPVELSEEPVPPPSMETDQALALPEEPATPVPPAGMTEITNLRYRGNDGGGGTFVIEGNAPLAFRTRSNPDARQFIIEVPGAELPGRLKKQIRSRDEGGMGSLQASQNAGSDVARFVVQLREGAPEPLVQQEGNSLLVVGGAMFPDMSSASPIPEGNVELADAKILTSQSLAEFLSGNTKFYGKRISIETSSMDIRDVFRFITEESGVNMVVTDDVKGNISLKLRQVPWDQALVVIMKARRLGYARQGNVLRIAPQEQLRQEEDDATKLAQAKRAIEPLKVRMFPISYAKVEDLEKRVVSFLSDRGRVVGDPRTNSIVVTDVQDNLERVAKIITSLDIQPPQVLIEGKIVEAGERFTRSIGINWGFGGADIQLGRNKNGPVNLIPGMTISNGVQSGSNRFNLSLGTLDFFGDINAALSLSEEDLKVKVLSSPRILTLTNETANIAQTTEVPVRQVTVNGNTSTETFSFKPLTLKLEVTPQITADSAIIMKVVVKRDFQGAVLTNGSFSVNTREANSRILVKNGQTAVIGGIYQSDATDSDTGVPWLREIPFLGALFRGKNTSRDKSELLIFLTPRIVGQNTMASPPSMDM